MLQSADEYVGRPNYRLGLSWAPTTKLSEMIVQETEELQTKFKLIDT